MPPVFTSETCWSMLGLLSCPLFPSSAPMMGLAADSCCGCSTPHSVNKDIPLDECLELSEIAQLRTYLWVQACSSNVARNTGEFFWLLLVSGRHFFTWSLNLSLACASFREVCWALLWIPSSRALVSLVLFPIALTLWFRFAVSCVRNSLL